MVALFSLRGGTGVTSLAVNLAIAVAVSQETKVSLVDLAALGGHTALMLGVRPTSNVRQLLATDTAEFSSETIEPHYIQHSSGVRLLASAPGFHRNLSLADDRLLRLIQGLKSASPLTVLDVPHMLEPHFAPVLKLLDRVILLLSSDMPSVQSTAIALQGLVSLGMADSQIRLVINQLSASNTLPVETIQRVLKRPILGTIPFDPNMLAAVNSGKPLLLSNPKSPAAKAISQLAEKLFTP
jgi:pilus assembly protein CpaE